MTDWPILSTVTFLPLLGTLIVLIIRGDEESARRNFVNAVDVADAIAQGSGLPFRKTYEIASKAVKLSEAKGAIDPKVVEALAREPW